MYYIEANVYTAYVKFVQSNLDPAVMAAAVASGVLANISFFIAQVLLAWTLQRVLGFVPITCRYKYNI